MKNTIADLKSQLASSREQIEELNKKSLLSSEKANSKIMELEKEVAEQASEIHTLKI